jgi:hypothetical protein
LESVREVTVWARTKGTEAGESVTVQFTCRSQWPIASNEFAVVFQKTAKKMDPKVHFYLRAEAHRHLIT